MKKYKAILSDGGHILFEDTQRRKDQAGKIYKNLCDQLAAENKSTPTEDLFRKVFYQIKNASQTVLGVKSEMYNFLYSIFGTSYHPEETLSERSAIVPRDGVVETLNVFLIKRIPFVVLTDAAQQGTFLTEKFGKTFPAAFFLTSLDVGMNKPAKGFFDKGLGIASRIAERSLDIAEVCFVGHDLEELVGAYMLGFDTIACYVDDDEREAIDRVCTHHIQSFSDLADFV